MRETIYEASWAELLPEPLKNDRRMVVLASVIAEQKRKIAGEIWRNRFWTDLDSVPEQMLDVLAYDLKIDWWDESYSVDEKRKTLKESLLVHKHMGTKYAVETAISAIYPRTVVEEWFEYGGDPYTFRLTIDATDFPVNTERHRQVLQRVNYYKNVRSHLERVKYTVYSEKAQAYCASAFLGSYMAVTVNVAVNGTVDKPHVRVPVFAGVSTGTYMKIITEVAVNGLE